MTTIPAAHERSADGRAASVLTSSTRRKRPGSLSASLTFGRRTLLKIRHAPEHLFDVTAFPVLLVLMFTFLFGGVVAGSTREYVQFLLPGILVQAVTLITIFTGTALNHDLHNGMFDRVRSLPVWRPALFIGPLLGDALRYSVSAAVVISLGLALGFRPDGGSLGVMAGVALLLWFAFALSWVWTAAALVVRTPQALHGVSMVVLFPLTFLSNVFVDPATMPGWLRSLVDLNPISHLVTAVRGLMAGSVETGELAWVLGASAVLLMVFAPLTMRLYGNRQ